MKKNSTNIRVTLEDQRKWKEYCKTLGETSPGLFKKLMTSPKIELDRRILQEARKKQEEVAKKLNLM